MKHFTVLPAHLKLLNYAYVSWNGVEHGAPSIDPKRPYGDSDVYESMAKILGLVYDKEADEPFNNDEIKMMDTLHKETQTVLQIVLAHGEMVPGNYVAADYSSDWIRITKPTNSEVNSRINQELIAACESVLRHIATHQVYDKDSKSILERAVAKAKGEFD